MRNPGETDTETLLARAAQGDQSAAGRLLVRHGGRLHRMVAVRMDPQLAARVDPSDVVQEALLVALQRLPEYLRARPVPFYPWLRQIAYERLVDVWRRHVHAGNRTVRREEPLKKSDSGADLIAERLLAESQSLLQRLIRKEMLGRLRQALADLSADDREVLVLRHLEHLSTAETAAVLGISATAVKQRHLRAIRRVRRLLGEGLLGGGK